MSELDERDEDAFDDEGQGDVTDELEDVEDDDALAEEEDDDVADDEEEDYEEWDEEDEEAEENDVEDDDVDEEVGDGEEDDVDDSLEGDDAETEAELDDELEDDELDGLDSEDESSDADAEDVGEEEAVSSSSGDTDEGDTDGISESSTGIDEDTSVSDELGIADPVNDELAFDAESASDDAGDIDGVIESRAAATSGDSANRRIGLQFEQASLPAMEGDPIGLRRAGPDGIELIDAMAGRASVFGFGYEPIIEALQDCARGYLGDGSVFEETPSGKIQSGCGDQLRQMLGDSPSVSADSLMLFASADFAVESAIQMARRYRPDKAFRTVALVGSDHGRTGMCRTASGRPELHEGLGPMMAGFCHVPNGDLDAVRAVIDEQTACLLFAPIDLRQAASVCDAAYLTGLREICNERGILLVVDETQVVFGSSGAPFTFSTVADIHADIVVASAGLFGGLPGGLVLASHQVTGGSIELLDHYPLLACALETTLAELSRQGLPQAATESAREFVVSMAEQLSGFEFVRDVQVLGMTIGIETDMDARDIVSAAASRGLRIEAAGETAIRIQPPLVMTHEDRQLLLDRLVETMEIIERETAELSL